MDVAADAHIQGFAACGIPVKGDVLSDARFPGFVDQGKQFREGRARNPVTAAKIDVAAPIVSDAQLDADDAEHAPDTLVVDPQFHAPDRHASHDRHGFRNTDQGPDEELHEILVGGVVDHDQVSRALDDAQQIGGNRRDEIELRIPFEAQHRLVQDFQVGCLERDIGCGQAKAAQAQAEVGPG